MILSMYILDSSRFQLTVDASVNTLADDWQTRHSADSIEIVIKQFDVTSQLQKVAHFLRQPPKSSGCIKMRSVTPMLTPNASKS